MSIKVNLKNKSIHFLSDNFYEANIDKFDKIGELILNRNYITEIPEEISCFINLRVFCISNNSIRKLPDNLFKLNKLQTIDCSHNKIAYINEKISNLKLLNNFCIVDNQIKYIPEKLFELTNLRRLILNTNYISIISESLSNLTELTELSITNNLLKKLPNAISQLHNLTKFSYEGNMVDYVQPHIVRILERIMMRGTECRGTVYRDAQNIHNHSIQDSFRQSVYKLFESKPTITYKDILQDLNKMNQMDLLKLIENYSLDNSVHTELYNIQGTINFCLPTNIFK